MFFILGLGDLFRFKFIFRFVLIESIQQIGEGLIVLLRWTVAAGFSLWKYLYRYWLRGRTHAILANVRVVFDVPRIFDVWIKLDVVIGIAWTGLFVDFLFGLTPYWFFDIQLQFQIILQPGCLIAKVLMLNQILTFWSFQLLKSISGPKLQERLKLLLAGREISLFRQVADLAVRWAPGVATFNNFLLLVAS